MAGGLLKDYSRNSLNVDQCKDTGMAMVLILLLLGLAAKRNYVTFCAIGLLALDMIRPQIFRPAAVVWFGLSHLLGMITSRIVLSIIFFVVVTPVGLIRRVFGADTLKLKLFKRGRESVMERRDHKFCADDIVKPY
jgi:Saxitoxin biosynthesis operon protein SxtJ